MKDNIYLFESYLNGNISKEDKESFENRLHSDKQFASDFKVFLFTVKCICQEAEQDNIEFAKAMESIPQDQLQKIIGQEETPERKRNPNIFRRQFAWIASIAAILIIGVFSIIQIEQSGRHQLDNAIVAYNPVPDISRNGEELPNISAMTGSELKNYIPELEKEYRNAPSDDIQAAEMAGMRLAMAYVRLHDRRNAKKILTEMKTRFADDPAFTEHCDMIISQLNN